MPCFCFGVTSDCSFGGYNAHKVDVKSIDDLVLTDKWGRPSKFSKGKGQINYLDSGEEFNEYLIDCL